MQNKRNIVIVTALIIVVIIIAVIALFLSRRNFNESTEMQIEEQSEEEIISQDPRQVVGAFMDAVIKSAPPDGDFSEVKVAVSYLSPGAPAFIPFNPEEATSGDLVRMVKLEDVPDLGYDVGTYEVEGIQAKVPVTMKYGGESIVRFFNLSYVDEKWQIDYVSLQ